MSAELVPFPVPPGVNFPRAAISPAARPRANGRRYDFAAMTRLLALDGLEPRGQIDRLRLLAQRAGMPLPLNPRVWGGDIVTGPRTICKGSRWCALEVDAWLAGQPFAVRLPVPAARTAPPASASIRHHMAHRAMQIGARA